MALVPGTIYFLAEEALAVDGARLPAQDPGLGAVIVISMAALAYTALHLLTARLVVKERFPRARPTSGPTPWASTPQEPAEEFLAGGPDDDLVEAQGVGGLQLPGEEVVFLVGGHVPVLAAAHVVQGPGHEFLAGA